jgi:hypothetical protein
LLVGLTHAGLLPAAALPEVHAVLVPAFTSLPFERLAEPPA